MANEEKKPRKKAVTRKTMDKWKKKKWYEIIASKEFNKKVIGETPSEKANNLIGRTVKVSLAELTNQKQKRHVIVFFQINDAQGQKAYTQIVGHEINPSYIGRIVKRRSSKIQNVQTIQSKDGKKVKVKSVAVTSRKVNRKQETAIRKIMSEKIAKNSSKKDFSQLIQELIFGVTSSKIFKDIKKIAPIKRIEIIKSSLVEGK